MDRIARRFARVEPRRRARAFVLGLLADLPRENCWTIAEHAGDADSGRHAAPAGPGQVGRRRGPGRPARLRRRAPRRPDDAVLVVDETGDLKKGTAHGRGAAPVHRHRRADRERPGRGLPGLRRPARARADRPGAVPPAVLDRATRTAAGRPGSPTTSAFATKPALAARMIARALDAGVAGPAGWPATRSTAATRTCAPSWRTARVGYVLAVACDHRVPTARRAAPRRRAGRAACRNGPGSGSPPAPAPRATASTTGPGSTIADRTGPATPPAGC